MTLKLPRVIGPGEVLWDCFFAPEAACATDRDDAGDSAEQKSHRTPQPVRRMPGGATANCVFHATQLGCEGFVVSRVGTDDAGCEMRRFLREQGLATDFIQDDAEKPTGWVTVQMADAGQHRFTIHEDVAWDRLEFTDALRDLMTTADAVCFGSLAQRRPISRATIQRCLRAARPECLIVCDVNLRQHFFDAETLSASLRASDIVKLNDEEVQVLASLLKLPTSGLTDFAAGMREAFGVRLVCVTRGAAGCFLATEDETVDRPGRAVAVVDTVGAGDAFTAALIVTQLERWPLEPAARFANEVGALVASRPGAMPPLKDEFQRLKDAMR